MLAYTATTRNDLRELHASFETTPRNMARVIPNKILFQASLPRKVLQPVRPGMYVYIFLIEKLRHVSGNFLSSR